MTDELAALEPIETPPPADLEVAAAADVDVGVADAVPAEADVPEATETEPSMEPAGETEPDVESEPEPPAGPVTVGRMAADAFRRAGVRWAFTVPGESFLGLLEGLAGAGINVVATRHEGAAAFMAEAHAQLTGRPAAALGTRAVGASNLAIGVHTAFADSSPMFVLVGQVEKAARGHEGFQEVDLAGSIGRLAKWAAEPHDVDEAVAAVGEAVGQALGGRPGPVLLAFHEDLLDELVPAGEAPVAARPAPPKPSEDEIRSVLRLLLGARRPVILAGAGVLRARTSNDLVRFADLTRVPVIASWRRGDVISNDHPLYLGMAGYGAPPTVRERLAEADAILVIGSRLNEITSFGWSIPGPDTRWAHVDLVP
ncbi:MAG TPA: thiamine pyrophosphate-binding protein, partial [Candidatus Limnocylindrales bacterium]